MKPKRRHVLMAGAAAAVATVASAESSSAADLYGSGQLGDWTILSRAISTDATIKYVRDNDGVYMFGDSISVQDGKALAISADQPHRQEVLPCTTGRDGRRRRRSTRCRAGRSSMVCRGGS